MSGQAIERPELVLLDPTLGPLPRYASSAEYARHLANAPVVHITGARRCTARQAEACRTDAAAQCRTLRRRPDTAALT